MIVEKLLNNAQRGGFTHKVVLTHADLTETTANTAQTIELITTKLGTLVTNCAMYKPTDFQDASDANLNTTTIQIGDGGSTARYLASTELNVNGTEVDAFVDANSVDTIPYVYTSANTIDATIGSMAAKSISNVDAGEVWIWLNIVELSE